MERTGLLTVTDRPSAPVFVDTTGRRARWLRVLAIVTVLVFAAYLGALATGLFGTSVDLSTAMPTATATASATASAAAS